jgi:glycosyltransferase involved in cell wall biosynthesis
VRDSKKIWILNFFAGTDASGWGERHFYLSKHFEKKGYEVTIFSSSFNHMFKTYPETQGQFTYERAGSTQFCWVKTPKYKASSPTRFFSMLVFTFKLLFVDAEKTGGKPDVILVSSMPIFPIWAGRKLKKRFRAKKLVFEVRDFWPLTPILLGGYSAKHPVLKIIGWFEKYGYKNSDSLVSVLPGGDKHFNKFEHRGELHHVPNGISLELDKSSNLPVELEDQIPENKFIIGYAGTIGLANAMEYVIDAAVLLKNQPEFHFVLVGDGYKKQELMERCDYEELTNVTFIPKIEKGLVRPMLEKFDVAIISWYKSELYELGVSANKFFDYMLASRPVLVAGELFGNPIKLAECGVITEPESGSAIKNGLLELFAMKDEEREVLGQKGREYVLKHHTYEKLADDYLKVF